MAYDSDKKPSGLSVLTALDDTDTVIVGDTSDTIEVVKTISWSNVKTAITTLIEGLSSYFNVTSDDSDAITEGVTNLFLTTSERTKLTNIEALADVTDEANVTDALDGATLTAATVATGDKILIQDVDAADVLKTATAQSVADLYSVTESDVTAHQAALSITESQISDLGSYTTASSADTLTNKTIDGDNNTISNLDIGNEVDWAASTDVSDASAFTSGDKVLIFEAGVGLRKVDYDDLPSGSGGIANVVEDTTPQLGGQLDVNGNAIGDGTLELITFTETVSAVNQVNITNAATGNGPTISAAGDDTNIDLNIQAKGSGNVVLSSTTGIVSAKAGGATAEVVNLNGAQTMNNKTLKMNTESIIDENNNELVSFVTTASAVNEFTIADAATGNGPELQATGDDTNIDIELVPKGSGRVKDGGTNVQLELAEGAFADGDKTKLDGIETSADVTDTANVTSAGALMDSELTDIAAVKALADADVSTTNTGTSTTAFVTPDGLAGSYAGTKSIGIMVTDGSGAITTGDGKAYFRVPAALNGMNLSTVAASLTAPSTSGTPTIQIARGRQAAAGSAHAFVDMLSTAITIDANEYDSKDATTAAVINGSNDDVATGDLIRIDVDGVGSGPTAVLSVNCEFRLP